VVEQIVSGDATLEMVRHSDQVSLVDDPIDTEIYKITRNEGNCESDVPQDIMVGAPLPMKGARGNGAIPISQLPPQQQQQQQQQQQYLTGSEVLQLDQPVVEQGASVQSSVQTFQVEKLNEQKNRQIFGAVLNQMIQNPVIQNPVVQNSYNPLTIENTNLNNANTNSANNQRIDFGMNRPVQSEAVVASQGANSRQIQLAPSQTDPIQNNSLQKGIPQNLANQSAAPKIVLGQSVQSNTFPSVQNPIQANTFSGVQNPIQANTFSNGLLQGSNVSATNSHSGVFNSSGPVNQNTFNRFNQGPPIQMNSGQSNSFQNGPPFQSGPNFQNNFQNGQGSSFQSGPNFQNNFQNGSSFQNGSNFQNSFQNGQGPPFQSGSFQNTFNQGAPFQNTFNQSGPFQNAQRSNFPSWLNVNTNSAFGNMLSLAMSSNNSNQQNQFQQNQFQGYQQNQFQQNQFQNQQQQQFNGARSYNPMGNNMQNNFQNNGYNSNSFQNGTQIVPTQSNGLVNLGTLAVPGQTTIPPPALGNGLVTIAPQVAQAPAAPTAPGPNLPEGSNSIDESSWFCLYRPQETVDKDWEMHYMKLDAIQRINDYIQMGISIGDFTRESPASINDLYTNMTFALEEYKHQLEMNRSRKQLHDSIIDPLKTASTLLTRHFPPKIAQLIPVNKELVNQVEGIIQENPDLVNDYCALKKKERENLNEKYNPKKELRGMIFRKVITHIIDQSLGIPQLTQDPIALGMAAINNLGARFRNEDQNNQANQNNQNNQNNSQSQSNSQGQSNSQSNNPGPPQGVVPPLGRQNSGRPKFDSSSSSSSSTFQSQNNSNSSNQNVQASSPRMGFSRPIETASEAEIPIHYQSAAATPRSQEGAQSQENSRLQEDARSRGSQDVQSQVSQNLQANQNVQSISPQNSGAPNTTPPSTASSTAKKRRERGAPAQN